MENPTSLKAKGDREYGAGDPHRARLRSLHNSVFLDLGPVAMA